MSYPRAENSANIASALRRAAGPGGERVVERMLGAAARHRAPTSYLGEDGRASCRPDPSSARRYVAF
jgi:hypothetical protein